MERGIVDVVEEEFIASDGVRYTYLSIKKPLHDNNGKIVRPSWHSHRYYSTKTNRRKVKYLITIVKRRTESAKCCFGFFF